MSCYGEYGDHVTNSAGSRRDSTFTFSLKRHIIHVHVITLHLVIYSASSTGVTEGRENMSPKAKRAELTAKKAEEAG